MTEANCEQFKAKTPFQDDFWITFLNVWLPLYSAYSSVPLLTLTGKYPISYVFCVGKDINEPFEYLGWSPRVVFGHLVMQVEL